MSDMLSYRIGMLKNLSVSIQKRIGNDYVEPRNFEIAMMARESLNVCPGRTLFALWKDSLEENADHFPGLEEMKSDLHPDRFKKGIKALIERLNQNTSKGER